MAKTEKPKGSFEDDSLFSPAEREEAARRAVAFWTEESPPSEPPPRTVREGRGRRPTLEPTILCADVKPRKPS